MARSFNGSSDVITISAAPVTNYPFTISCWFYPTNITSDRVMFGSGSNAGNADQLLIGIDSATGKMEGTVSNGSATFTTALVGASLALNTWYLGVFVCTSATNRTIYQNGSGTSANDATNSVFGGSTNNTWMGSFRATLDFFPGRVADCAIWNTNLSTTQVDQLANGVRPVNVNSANLKGWWPLDGYASPETDLSGNGNTGTLTGTAQVLGPPALWRISA